MNIIHTIKKRIDRFIALINIFYSMDKIDRDFKEIDNKILEIKERVSFLESLLNV